jgi:hypothetical protein
MGTTASSPSLADLEVGLHHPELQVTKSLQLVEVAVEALMQVAEEAEARFMWEQ